MKKAIFTVLLGKYDDLKPAPRFKDWDAVLFTDHHYPNTKGWIVHKIKPVEDTAKESRKYKFLSHVWLKHYDLVCHIDANMVLNAEPPSRPTWFTHPMRSNVKDEIARCIQLKKAPVDELKAQREAYKKAGFPDTSGLYQNGFFVRAHTQEQNTLMEYTFELVQKYTYRDQLALPFAIWKTGIYPENILTNKEWRRYISIHPHIKRPVSEVKHKSSIAVHHITPGRADKNIGLALNSLISCLPDHDWICVRDIDTLPTYHEVFFKQCEDIAKNSNFHLISCFTNRLGLKYQLHNAEFSENFDMKYHREIGKQRFLEYGSQVIPCKSTVAGLMLLFSKSTWKKAGGFKEGGIQINGAMFDYYFSQAVLSQGMRIGIAPGIYLHHQYRPDAKNPKREYQHLL